MTHPDRESRFDDVDLTKLTIVELEDYLSKIVDRHVIHPDAFFARAYELRIAEVQRHLQREVAIRNRRETERQDVEAAQPPGHVCPASYALGPDDLDLLQELVDHPTRLDGAFGTRQVIRNILAAHRAPEPEDGPLPEVVRCGAVGCVSSIRKSYLPSGWVSIDGAWRCPRCKLEVPS